MASAPPPAAMPLRSVGRQGLRLPAISLGTMGMSWAYDTAYPAAEAGARADAALAAAAAAGCTALVTARIYSTAGLPHNEELVARALARAGEGAGEGAWTVVTKIGIDLSRSPPHAQSEAELRAQLAASLAALGARRVDVLVLNRPDPRRDIRETMRVFADFVAQGLCRYVGLSEASEAEVRAAHAVLPLSCLEAEYSLCSRGIEALLPTLRELGIGLLAYSPLSRGLLTRRLPGERDWRRQQPRFDAAHLPANLAAADALAAAAAARGCTPAQLALAWLLAQGEDIVPIPGSTSPARIAENAGAAALRLTPAEADELRALVPEATGDRYAGMHATWESKSKSS